MSRTSRRQFAKMLAAAGASVPLSALAQTPPPQYTRHLTPDELARMEKDFADSAPALERLRAVKLTNADEPDFVFAARVRR